MTQVNLQGKEMSAEEAADLVIEEVENRARGRSPWLHLGTVLSEWCEPETRFAVQDAVYEKTIGERLN
jgi:hypothetical protein